MFIFQRRQKQKLIWVPPLIPKYSLLVIYSLIFRSSPVSLFSGFVKQSLERDMVVKDLEVEIPIAIAEKQQNHKNRQPCPFFPPLLFSLI